MKDPIFSINIMLVLALLLSLGLVGYNLSQMPRYEPPRVSSYAVPVMAVSDAASLNTSSGAAVSASLSMQASAAQSEPEETSETTSQEARPEKDPNARVNLNTANLEQLQAVPGIGPVLAQRILDYREQIGVFTDLGQLHNVRGIGDVTLQKIAPHFVLQDTV